MRTTSLVTTKILMAVALGLPMTAYAAFGGGEGGDLDLAHGPSAEFVAESDGGDGGDVDSQANGLIPPLDTPPPLGQGWSTPPPTSFLPNDVPPLLGQSFSWSSPEPFAPQPIPVPSGIPGDDAWAGQLPWQPGPTTPADFGAAANLWRMQDQAPSFQPPVGGIGSADSFGVSTSSSVFGLPADVSQWTDAQFAGNALVGKPNDVHRMLENAGDKAEELRRATGIFGQKFQWVGSDLVHDADEFLESSGYRDAVNGAIRDAGDDALELAKWAAQKPPTPEEQRILSDTSGPRSEYNVPFQPPFPRAHIDYVKDLEATASPDDALELRTIRRRMELETALAEAKHQQERIETRVKKLPSEFDIQQNMGWFRSYRNQAAQARSAAKRDVLVAKALEHLNAVEAAMKIQEASPEYQALQRKTLEVKALQEYHRRYQQALKGRTLEGSLRRELKHL